jgi:hypothetical protein
MSHLAEGLERAMELHDARIRRRGKRFLKSAPNTMRSRTIYHEMQHIHEERGEQSTQNKLILLLPMKKRRADDGGRTSRAVKNMRWRTRHGTVNKVKNTLTKEI